MVEIKTFKEIKDIQQSQSRLVFENNVKKEVIKQIKWAYEFELKEFKIEEQPLIDLMTDIMNAEDWMKRFFNITDEELK